MKAAFYTLGCKVNQYETEVMRELLESNGYDITDIDCDPEIFILNSCTVTAESDRKTRQLIRKYRRILPHSTIILTGCLPQAFPDEAAKLVDADIILGNKNHAYLIEALKKHFDTGEKIIEIEPHEKGDKFTTRKINRFFERTRAFMKIEDGCDRYCSYCIIPTARGRVRSKIAEDIYNEAKELAAAGYVEIVLVGINLSAYGKDIGKELCDAVDSAAMAEGIKRVRLGSLEPDQISDEVLERLKNQPKYCPQFHLSVQSGCDRTLNRMNRHYDTAFYKDLVLRIRNIFEDASITTDIMVGFPGETDEEHKQSLCFAKEIGFAKAHVFSYSPRKGTVAYKLENQIPRAIKEHRSREMIEITEKSRIDFMRSQIGKTYTVLFETYTDGVAMGYTPNYTPVKLKCNADLHGKMVKVKISDVLDNYCIASI